MLAYVLACVPLVRVIFEVRVRIRAMVNVRVRDRVRISKLSGSD